MAFEENKHPRAKDGKFTSKGNEGAGSGSTTKEKTDGKNKVYDFDKWAKETNSDKTKHVAYIDTNKKYNPNEILDIVSSDDGWNVKSGGDNILFSHKSGATYVYDRNTGKVELTTDELENEKGAKAHTQELTDYIQNAIKNGATDPEEIYQNSPYSIHSHDEMIEIANKYLNQPFNSDIDYDNIEYPKGTSKEYTMSVNKRFNDAQPILQKLGIKLEDFGGRPSKEGGYEDNGSEIMDKYVFNPFSEKYPTGIHNEEWTRDYKPIYDAIEAVTDKNYNDWWIREHSKKETPKQTEQQVVKPNNNNKTQANNDKPKEEDERKKASKLFNVKL